MALMIELVRGDSSTKVIPLTLSGSPYVVAEGTNLIFSMKVSRSDSDENAVLQKTLGVGLTVSGSAATVAFVHVDTKTIAVTKYVYDVQAQEPSGAVFTVAQGDVSMKGDVTRNTDTSVPIHTTEPSAVASAAASALEAAGHAASINPANLATAAQLAAETAARTEGDAATLDAANDFTDAAITDEAQEREAADDILATAITEHAGNTANPHGVTKAQVGLPLVDNTPDASKPVSTAQAAADALKVDLTGTNIVNAAALRSKLGICTGLTVTGTYAGAGGTAVTVSVGFRPDLIVVRDTTLDRNVAFSVGRVWYERSLLLAATQLVIGITPTDTGFIVSPSATGQNASGSTYAWFAYKDNGAGSLLWHSWAGNGLTNRVFDAFAGKTPAALIIKRDNTNKPIVAVAGRTAYAYDGTASSGVTIDTNTGNFTLEAVSGTNEWSGTAGEQCMALGFVNDHRGCVVNTYTGTGADNRILYLPWEPDFCLVIPRNQTATTPTVWFSSMTAGNSYPTTAAAVSTTRIKSVAGNLVTLGTDASVNASGNEYTVIAIRRSRNGFALSGSNPFLDQLRYTSGVLMPATGYIDCGTDDSLSLTGALTLEWFGVNLNTNTAAQAGGAGANDADVFEPLIWRQLGADGSSSTGVNYGMMSGPPGANNSTGNGLWLAVCGRYDLPQSGAYNVDSHQPWQTGIPMPTTAPMHVVATHAGGGVWRTYINGVRVKDRDRDMLSAAVPIANIAGVAGARLTIGARSRDGSIVNAGVGGILYLARIYARALTAAEVNQNFRALFTEGPSPASGFLEEWDARNASGSSLPATVSAANNGTLTNCVLLKP